MVFVLLTRRLLQKFDPQADQCFVEFAGWVGVVTGVGHRLDLKMIKNKTRLSLRFPDTDIVLKVLNIQVLSVRGPCDGHSRGVRVQRRRCECTLV